MATKPTYEMSLSLACKTRDKSVFKRYDAVLEKVNRLFIQNKIGFYDGNDCLLDVEIIDVKHYFFFKKSKQKEVEEFINQELKDFLINKKVKFDISTTTTSKEKIS